MRHSMLVQNELQKYQQMFPFIMCCIAFMSLHSGTNFSPLPWKLHKIGNFRYAHKICCFISFQLWGDLVRKSLPFSAK